MEKHYLFFCSHGYAIPILRPLQAEIERQGGKVAWMLERTCPDSQLTAADRRVQTVKQARQWNPIAVFAPGDWIYHFLPGVKVRVCHGYPIYKRGGTEETHFKIRGWFDIYCSTGPSSTPVFKALEEKDGSFCTYETGWAKADSIVRAREQADRHPRADRRPSIFVATTFTSYVTQLRTLLPTIRHLVDTRDWQWKITMHPKLDDADLKQQLTELARTHANVEFYPVTPEPDVMAQTDVMLCDASSITVEYMMLDRPVVTFRNTRPGAHLLNVTELDAVESALETALQRPDSLMTAMRQYVAQHEAHLDGHNCERILQAVDDFIEHRRATLRRKPLNLFRHLKIRWRYWRQMRS